MFEGAYPPGVTGKMIDALDVRQCCGSCIYFDGEYCMKEWNNLDRDYCIPEMDIRKESDCCYSWEGEE